MLNPGIKLVEPITTAAAAEIRTVLGEHLGATLVESVDPLWTPDPSCEQMQISFRRALARLVPVFMPDLLFRLREDAQPLFAAFAAAIRPTEFLPGLIFGGGDLAAAIRHRSTTWSPWPKGGSNRCPISISSPSSSKNWRPPSGSMSRNIWFD